MSFLRSVFGRWHRVALAQGALLLTLACFARAEIVLHPGVQSLGEAPQGPFVRTRAGSIVGGFEAGTLVSLDEGATWEKRMIFDAKKFASRPERALLRTQTGVLLYAFLNEKERAFRWDDTKGGPQPGCRLPVYVVRSLDDGKTFEQPQLIQEGWCGAVRQMIQLKSGRVLLVCQRAEANPGRHVTVVYASDDQGLTWKASAPIDLAAEGNYAGPSAGLKGSTHGGAIEGTVYERATGELRLVLRVPHGHFLEFSSRDGLKWTTPIPSVLEASDSPGMIIRLASGRLMLAWNRYTDAATRIGRREELSVAFSGNDGITWSAPQVVAVSRTPAGEREGKHWIAYPYLFEVQPGEVWLSTMQGPLRVSLREQDFISPSAPALDGRSQRVILLGDSITRGVRSGVVPAETFAHRVQAALDAAGQRAQVHNVGIGSERTDLALARLERDVLSQRPEVVTVMYGTNDSWVDKGRDASRLTEAQYEANLRAIVARLHGAHIDVVLMTPPYFGDGNPRNGLGEDPNLRLGRYAVICRRVAASMKVPLVDHFARWEDRQRAGKPVQALTTDGCHPNAEGHAELALAITPVVAAALEKRRVSARN